MKQSESISARFIPPCEGEDRTLFESISNFRSDQARQAAIKCASCLLIEDCRRDLADPAKFQELHLPTVRSGVYVNAGNTRKVVDLFEGDSRGLVDSRVSYDRFIDSDDPAELVSGLRRILGEEKISLNGGKGEDRKAEIAGIDLWEIDAEGEARLRHFKALYQARDKGFLLSNPLVAYRQTVDVIVEDFKELSAITDEVTAMAVVGYFSAKDLSELFSLAGADENVPDWMIKRFLHANRRNPQTALDRYLEDYERLLASPSAEGIPPSILRRLVLENTKNPDGALAAFNVRLTELTDHVYNHRAVKSSTLRYIALHNSKSHLAALERFEKIYESLMDKYGAAGLDPATARLFALQFPNVAGRKAEQFAQTFKDLRAEFADIDALDEDDIRKFARLYDSPREAIATYLENVERLTLEHPNLPYGIIRTISRNLKTADKIATEVSAAQKELNKQYAGDSLVTAKVIDSLSNRYRAKATEQVELFLQNVEFLSTTYEKYSIDISLLSDVALYHPKNPDKAMQTLLKLMGILSWPSRPASLNKKVGDSQGSVELGDLIKGGISAEDEFFRIHNRENLVARAKDILDALDDEAREQVEIYFGFKDSSDGSVPSDQDIDAILESLRPKRHSPK